MAASRSIYLRVECRRMRSSSFAGSSSCQVVTRVERTKTVSVKSSIMRRFLALVTVNNKWGFRMNVKKNEQLTWPRRPPWQHVRPSSTSP